jgi:tetratricopeptide (TPR) repeat protein
VFFRIYQHASCSEAEESIKDLLKELDYHPLSINILANAAQQNGWSPATLLKRWNDRHSKVLVAGKGRLQSLSDTMQLSLSSPSIQDLGEDGRRALAIIAFLPQGLNENLAGDLLPSLPEVDAICDVLCMQSLVYRQDNFLKVLAPIRYYVRDSLQAPDSTCLQEIRTFYYRTVASCSTEREQYADIIISDHLNIEYVVTFNLACIPDNAKETYAACWQFLERLEWHLPRPTTLTPAISNIVENSSTWTLKAYCLCALANLYVTLSQLVEASQAFQTAEALYLTAGCPQRMAHSLITRADLLRCQGRFSQSQNLLEDLQRSDSWMSLGESTKARAWNFLDMARMYTFTVSADELFVNSMEDHRWGLDSKIWHWRAKLYNSGDIVQVNARLEDLSMQRAGVGNVFLRKCALEGLAEIAFCEDRLSDAADNLQAIIEMFEGQHSADVLWYTVRKAVVVNKQENHDLARELIQKASEPFQFFSLRNAQTFLYQSSSSACIELTAGEYDRAESYFTATIEACDMQSNLVRKAFSIRGLGEIAFARCNFTLATQRFKETRSLCTEMGVPPQHLYSCLPLDTLPDKFKGWTLFLEGLAPFVNDTT